MSEPTMRRQRRRTLNDKQVAAFPRKRKRYVVTDPEQRSHYLRIPPQGPVAFYAAVRDPYGKLVWSKNGTADVLTIDESREITRTKLKRIVAGLPAIELPAPKPDSFKAVAEEWLKRHVAKKKLRTSVEIERVLAKYIYPTWATREFTSLRRSDVAALLDHVEDQHGPRMADVVLGVLRSIGNWYGSRSDDYLSPFLRHPPRDQGGKRARILDDHELRAVWRTAEAGGAFGAFVQLLLLTAQRRGAVARLRWDDISPDGTWTIPMAPREKSNAGALRLPPLALAIINAQPCMGVNPHVFAGQDAGPIGRFSHRHVAFRDRCGVSDWTLHDLRRTARSLMARAGVLSEHAERVLGHVIPGVEGVYDRHRYDAEKADALRRLAALIEHIVRRPEGNVVVPLQRAAVQP
jgi:integrase